MERATSTATLSRDDVTQAADPDLHRTHMALLAQSRQRVVRHVIAGRHDVPLGIQAMLAEDDWHEVRVAIAANPRAARSVLERLSKDKHRDVLVALIMNPEVPRELVDSLAHHRKEDVREAVATRLRLAKRFRVEQELTLDEKIPELRDDVILAELAPAPVAPADDAWQPEALLTPTLAPLEEDEDWISAPTSPYAFLGGPSLLRNRTSPIGGFRVSAAS